MIEAHILPMPGYSGSRGIRDLGEASMRKTVGWNNFSLQSNPLLHPNRVLENTGECSVSTEAQVSESAKSGAPGALSETALKLRVTGPIRRKVPTNCARFERR